MKTITITDEDFLRYIKHTYIHLTGYEWSPDKVKTQTENKVNLLNDLDGRIEKALGHRGEVQTQIDELEALKRPVEKVY